MKILRVIPSMDISQGGPVNGLINSSKELSKMGVVIDVACLNTNHDSKFEGIVNIYSFSSGNSKYSYSKEFSNWLQRKIKRYDAVLIHGVWQYHSYITAKKCRIANVPYYVFTHGMLDPYFDNKNFFKKIKKDIYWKYFESQTARYAEALLFTSKIERDLAVVRYSLQKINTKVIAYGSPEPLLLSSDNLSLFQKKHNIEKDCRIFSYVGRIDSKKGIDILIDSLAKLKDVNYCLLIAGPCDNSYAKSLIHKASHYGLDKKIRWLGLLDNKSKWAVYQLSEAFLLASHQENFGIVVSEALSTSTPVLITNKVNIYQDILDGEAGLVANDNMEDFSKIISKWISLSNEEIDKFSYNSRKLYEEKFSIISSASAIRELLNNGLSRS